MKQKAPIIVQEQTPEFISWSESVKKLVVDYYTTNFPNQQHEMVFTFGVRYIKVFCQSLAKDTTSGRPVHNSVWAFLDRTNGDVLKAAGCNAPAKHARGNIYDASNGTAMLTPYGPQYLR